MAQMDWDAVNQAVKKVFAENPDTYPTFALASELLEGRGIRIHETNLSRDRNVDIVPFQVAWAGSCPLVELNRLLSTPVNPPHR